MQQRIASNCGSKARAATGILHVSPCHVLASPRNIQRSCGSAAHTPVKQSSKPSCVRKIIARSAPAASAATLQKPSHPTEEILAMWRNADAVCFDVDCTVTINDSLDLLGKYMGVEEEVAALTHKAMEGTVSLAESLDDRLNIIDCKPSDIKGFNKQNPPKHRLVPNIMELITTLQENNIEVYLITGGFRELVAPLAAHLGVPMTHVLANRMQWQWDDETGQPTRLAGFDPSQPTSRNHGKPAAIAELREQRGFKTIIMVGDGITDAEAAQVAGGADLFIGYGGIVERPAVVEAAPWFVYDHLELIEALKHPDTVAAHNAEESNASELKKMVQSARKAKDAAGEEGALFPPGENSRMPTSSAVIA